VSPAQSALIAALLLVAVTHTMSRVGGALATIGWCVAALIYGVLEFGELGRGLVFLGIQTPPWLFVGAMVGVASYNGAIVFRAVRGRRRSAP
jgi:hypothetical protein